jgi:carboxymethylenebutenolidase
MAGAWETLQVDSKAMRVYAHLPEGEARPGVVVGMEGHGLDDFAVQMVDRLAGAGFAAIAPDLYHREDPNAADGTAGRYGRLRDGQVVRDVGAAIAYLRGKGSPKVGITGFCMGGRVAYLMAAREPGLAAAVVFYGGNTMRPWGEGPSPFELTAQIGCPVLGLFGAEDANPSPEDVAKLDAELTRLGKVHEFHSYPGAGHQFMTEGIARYNAAAAADAWPRAVAWFQKYLK